MSLLLWVVNINQIKGWQHRQWKTTEGNINQLPNCCPKFCLHIYTVCYTQYYIHGNINGLVCFAIGRSQKHQQFPIRSFCRVSYISLPVFLKRSILIKQKLVLNTIKRWTTTALFLMLLMFMRGLYNTLLFCTLLTHFLTRDQYEYIHQGEGGLFGARSTSGCCLPCRNQPEMNNQYGLWPKYVTS